MLHLKGLRKALGGGGNTPQGLSQGCIQLPQLVSAVPPYAAPPPPRLQTKPFYEMH